MTILGEVGIMDFDFGCFLTLGAEEVRYAIDGDVRAQYVTEVPGVLSGVDRFQDKVPLFFDNPEDPYQDFILPSFVFSNTSMTPAFDRQAFAAGVVARAPAKDAQEIVLPDGRVGYTKYETQLRADPYDIQYDLNIYGRLRQEMVLMLNHVMRKMRPPWFEFKVIDSLGDVRHYDAGEMSFSSTSELADIADRTQSMTVSFLVRAEIDTFEETVSPAMLYPRPRVELGAAREV
jgi:hypothetical protein